MFKRKKKFQIPVSAYEYRMILDALMSSREKLMAQGRYGAADTISYFGKVEQIIPYSQALKEQYVSGNLTEVTKDKKYAAVLEAVRQKVVK